MLNLVITEKCVLDNLALFGQSILKFEVLNRILIQIILTEKTRALNSVKKTFLKMQITLISKVPILVIL